MEDFMRISSKFMTGIVSKLITTVLHKKLGYGIDIKLDELFVTVEDDDKICLHLETETRMSKDELMRILKDNGLN